MKFRFPDLARAPEGAYRIRLVQSKTDQFGQGLQLPVSPTLVTMIHQWQELAGNYSDFIVPTINADGLITNERLAGAQLNMILRARQEEAELKLEPPLSGHSFRVGAHWSC